MGVMVFVNGREIAGKASTGTSIAAFPDVCLSPPPPIAGPVPIPYPNTASASDTANGSKTVMVHGKEVILQNSSFLKTSTGDEPATPNLGGGVITHKIKGKVYFASWSMDVKIEGKCAVRHLDIATHNHGSGPGNTPPWPHISSAGMPPPQGPCGTNAKTERDACDEYTPYGDKDPCPPKGKHGTYNKLSEDKLQKIAVTNQQNACLRARRCQLKPYEKKACCPYQTPHHLVEASAFHDKGRGPADDSTTLREWESYNAEQAPCVCVEGAGHGVGTHGQMHMFQSHAAIHACEQGELIDSKGRQVLRTIGKRTEQYRVTTFGDAAKSGAEALHIVFPESGCDKECTEAQILAAHKQMCGKDGESAADFKERKLKAVHTCNPKDEKLDSARKAIAERKSIVEEKTNTEQLGNSNAF